MAQSTEDAETKPTLNDLKDQVRTSFQNSDEEVEERKDGTDESDNEDGKDNSAEADNAQDADADGGEGSSDKDDSDDSNDDGGNTDEDSSDDSDSDKQGSEFRFSQFKGDGTPEAYTKNLEEAYLNSSTEALRIKEENEGLTNQVNAVKAAAQKDPEFGEKLISLLKDGDIKQDDKDSTGGFSDQATQTSDNPFLVNAETEWNENNEKSVKEFVDANPEVMTDPKINSDVKRWARVFTNQVYQDEKRLITTGEAMEKAYRYLGLEDKRKSNQDLVDGMKQNAAPTRPQTGKKKSSSKKTDTKQFSDLTLKIASNMGISKERLQKGTKR